MITSQHPNNRPARWRDILNNGTREQVIAWLEWNDHNGMYSDADMISEGARPLTLDQARDMMRGQIEEPEQC